jgi:predicted ATP-dependent serine protease
MQKTRSQAPAVSFLPVSRGRLGGKEKPGEPLPFALLSTALENVPAEPDWTWKGYLAPGAITLLAGRPKVGKSTLLFALVAALEAGEPLVELNTRPVGALLLSEERASTLAEKAHSWDLNGRIHLLMRHQANGRDWVGVVSESVDYCHRHGLGILVVDTWDKWTGLKGDAENNAGAILEALEPLVQAAGSDLAVLICAHQRKSFVEFGEAVRGSNALTGGVDVVLELERPRSDVLSGDGVRVLQAVSRFSGTPEELVIALGENGYEARGDALTAAAEVEQKQILSALAVLGEASYAKLREETGLPRTTVQRRLEELGDRVVKRGAGKRGDPFLFSAHSLTGQNETRALTDEERAARFDALYPRGSEAPT